MLPFDGPVRSWKQVCASGQSGFSQRSIVSGHSAKALRFELRCVRTFRTGQRRCFAEFPVLLNSTAVTPKRPSQHRAELNTSTIIITRKLLSSLLTQEVVARGRTWIGRIRSRNEDVYTLRPEFGFFAVADGMGGTSAGHIAARIAIDEISDHLNEVSQEREVESGDMVKAIELANEVVFDRGQTYSDFQGMGTTLVAMVVNDYKVTCGHVGDSRAYLLRRKELSRITRDHSVVQELVDRGEMTLEQARTAHNRNIVTRCIGPFQSVQPEITIQELAPGDVIMMCTDGISDFISDVEICEIMDAHSHNLPILLGSLIETADRHGSTDNITAVVAKIK